MSAWVSGSMVLGRSMTTNAFTVSQFPTRGARLGSSPMLQMRQVSSASLIIFTISSAWMLVGRGTVVTPAQLCRAQPLSHRFAQSTPAHCLVGLMFLPDNGRDWVTSRLMTGNPAMHAVQSPSIAKQIRVLPKPWTDAAIRGVTATVGS